MCTVPELMNTYESAFIINPYTDQGRQVWPQPECQIMSVRQWFGGWIQKNVHEEHRALLLEYLCSPNPANVLKGNTAR